MPANINNQTYSQQQAMLSFIAGFIVGKSAQTQLTIKKTKS